VSWSVSRELYASFSRANTKRPETRYVKSLSDRVLDSHRIAMEGWKARKEQLYKQQESVLQLNEEAERISLLQLSKRKAD
jgi:hypothetical protein